MIIPLTDIFEVFKESGSKNSPNLTEEKIYSYTSYFTNDKYPKIPVLSGSIFKEGITGYVPDLRTKKTKKNHLEGIIKLEGGINYYKNKIEGCITIVADGVYAGYSFYRPNNVFPIFCLNASCLVLFKKATSEIKSKYQDYNGLNLEWFYLKNHNFLKNMLIGYGVKHMTKTILASIDDIYIPSLEIQEKELKEIQKLYLIKNNFDKIKHQINSILSKEVNGYIVQIEDDFFNIFSLTKGIGGFTEECIYHSIEANNNKKIPVFGGEKTHISAKKFVGKNATNNKGMCVKYFEGECLIISLDGSAGCMTYKKKDNEFTLNHHAGILKLKKEYIDKINLKWFKYSYQNTLVELAVSKKSSRTLSKAVLEETIITFPKISTQKNWVKEIEELEKTRDKINLIADQITSLSIKSIS